MSLDLTKPVQTRGGCPVEIFCTDLKHGPYSIAGRYTFSDGSQLVGTWTADGKFNIGDNSDSSADLVQAPEKVGAWVNVYRTPGGELHFGTHRSKLDADRAADPERIACVPVEITLPAKG